MSAPLSIGQQLIAAGLYSKLSRQEYDALDLVNYSRLKKIRCPMIFRHACAHPGSTDSNTLKLGRVIHIAILEPDRWEKCVEVWRKKTKSGATGPRNGGEWDAFKAEHAGKEIILPDEEEMAKGIAASVDANPRARALLTGGRSEVTALARIGGFSCKARFDYLSHALPDLKSTRSAEPDDFGRDAFTYDYPSQAAFYSDVHFAATGERKPFYNVAIEKVPPYVVSVYRVPEEVLSLGRRTYRGWLGRLATCLAQDKWPGYFEGERDLILPRYAMREDADDGSPIAA